MTKPPEYLFSKTYDNVKREINSEQKKSNSLVAINICPIKIYTADKATERKIELFLKTFQFLGKKK